MEQKLIRAGILGVSGYSGGKVLEILLKHPHVRVTYVAAVNTEGPINSIWPQLRGLTKLVCEKYRLQRAVTQCDVMFLAVPHTAAMTEAPKLLKAGLRVIDLSGDYRLKAKGLYEKWYGVAHKDPVSLRKAVYGLPELYRGLIKKAKLLSNPGCYPTAAILALAPVLGAARDRVTGIVIDAKSGVSGAGKKLSAGLMAAEVNQNFKAYKVLQHQHTPEIEAYLSRFCGQRTTVTFVPHLLPVNHGILETVYVQLNKAMTINSALGMYQRFYKTEPFVRVLAKGEQPELKHVVGTNFCDIGLAADSDRRILVITSAIDNLIKGAAGQAVQNLNIMCGFDETTGLI